MPNFIYPKRGLHVIDVENLAGLARPSCQDVSEARRHYGRLVGVGEPDHVVVACNHGAAVEVGLHWEGRLLLNSGPDGADLALLDVLESERVDARFDRVYLASGDGIFTGVVAELVGRGVPVTVVSRPESLSRSLKFAASSVVSFDPPPPPPASLLRIAA